MEETVFFETAYVLAVRTTTWVGAVACSQPGPRVAHVGFAPNLTRVDTRFFPRIVNLSSDDSEQLGLGAVGRFSNIKFVNATQFLEGD